MSEVRSNVDLTKEELNEVLGGVALGVGAISAVSIDALGRDKNINPGDCKCEYNNIGATTNKNEGSGCSCICI